MAVPAPNGKGGVSAKEDAAQDLIDAIKSGNAKATNLALTRHYELCVAEKTESESLDDDEGY